MFTIKFGELPGCRMYTMKQPCGAALYVIVRSERTPFVHIWLSFPGLLTCAKWVPEPHNNTLPVAVKLPLTSWFYCMYPKMEEASLIDDDAMFFIIIICFHFWFIISNVKCILHLIKCSVTSTLITWNWLKWFIPFLDDWAGLSWIPPTHKAFFSLSVINT